MQPDTNPSSSPSPDTLNAQPAPSAPSAEHLSEQMNAEIDAAMKQLDQETARAEKAQSDARAEQRKETKAAAVTAGGRPAIRGPRVVQAGREHRPGSVVSVGPTDIFIEFGPKELGLVPRAHYPDDTVPKVGDRIEVVVDRFEPGENLFMCSRPGAVAKADWELLDAGQVVEGRVTGVVTGKDNKQAGIELEVAGHRAFMPASQVSLDRIPDLSVFIGEKMQAQVVRVERMGKGNIVLSRRDMLKAERDRAAEQIKTTLQEGQTIEGTVRKIMDFGAFVDIGGIDGLIHISDMSYDRVGFGAKAVSKHVQEGQKVTVRILKMDADNNRISLGLKQVQGDPFANAVSSITEGAELTGRVTKLLEFGAFVEVASGVEGLVHISEIDHKRIAKVEDALKQDEVVQVKVLKIDPSNRRISLSIKATKPMPEVRAPEGGGGGGPREGAGAGGGGGGGGGYGGGRGGGGGGGRGDFGGFGKGSKNIPGRSAEEILKETPALRRMREKFKKAQFKGGLS